MLHDPTEPGISVKSWKWETASRLILFLKTTKEWDFLRHVDGEEANGG